MSSNVERRKSPLSAMHPAVSHPQAPVEPQEALPERSKAQTVEDLASHDGETSEAISKVVTSKKSSKPAKDVEDPRERMPGIYTRASEAARIREAFQRNRIDEGYESLSDFFYKAAIKEVRRLEKRYNEGKEYEGIGNLKAGRPSKF